MMTLDASGINGIRTIDPALLEQELRSGRRVVVLDVRSHDEYAAGHVEGARSIPAHQLLGRRDELRGCECLQVVVVSRRTIRAHAAAVALALSGFADVWVLEGGMQKWSALGFDVERRAQISIRPASESA